MTDMTQPERPERADVPDSEPRAPQEGVEPTHIGVARHREARESFNPLAPQTPDTGPTAPTGPADRSSIESLRREAERLASRSQPAEAPSIPLGKPLKPRKETGIPLKAKIGAAAGALAVAAGGFLGFNKIRSGDGDERPGVIITDPTLKPTEPAPTFTPEVTQEPTQEPVETNTPEAPPLPEAKLPYKYINANVYEDGKLTLDITEGMPTRTEGPDNVYSGSITKTVEYYSLNGMKLNTEAFPEAAKMTIDGFDYGLLLAFSVQENIPEEQKDIVINPSDTDEVKLGKLHSFQERMANGEKFHFIMRANRDDSFVLEDVEFDLDKDWTYYIDEVDTPTPFITWQTDMRTGVRILPEAKQFRAELFSRYAGGQGFDGFENFFIAAQVAGNVLGYLPELTISKKIPDLLTPNINTQLRIRNERMFDIAQKFFIPDAAPGTYGKDWSDSTIHPIP